MATTSNTNKVAQDIKKQQDEEKAAEFAREAAAMALRLEVKRKEDEAHALRMVQVGKLASMLSSPTPRVFSPQGPGTLKGINLIDQAAIMVAVDRDHTNHTGKLYHFHPYEVEPVGAFQEMLEVLFHGVQADTDFEEKALEMARKNGLVVVTRSGFVTITPIGIELLLELRK